MIRVTFVTCTFKFYSSRNLELSITIILIINNFKVPVTSVNATFILDKHVVQTNVEWG